MEDTVARVRVHITYVYKVRCREGPCAVPLASTCDETQVVDAIATLDLLRAFAEVVAENRSYGESASEHCRHAPSRTIDPRC